MLLLLYLIVSVVASHALHAAERINDVGGSFVILTKSKKGIIQEEEKEIKRDQGTSRKHPNTIIGSGTSAIKTWSIKHPQRFTKIQADDTGTLNITGGESDNITVKADDNILEYISVRLSGDELVLQQTEKSQFIYKTPVVYTVQLSSATRTLLNSIITNLETYIKTPLTLKTLFLSTSNSNLYAKKKLTVNGNLTLKNENSFVDLVHVIANNMTINHSGLQSSLIRSGSISYGTFTISGTGAIRADNFAVQKLKLDQSGHTLVSCRVLKVISGSLGDPGDPKDCPRFVNYGTGVADCLVRTADASYQLAFASHQKKQQNTPNPSDSAS